jgi:hypothetical protein
MGKQSKRGENAREVALAWGRLTLLLTALLVAGGSCTDEPLAKAPPASTAASPFSDYSITIVSGTGPAATTVKLPPAPAQLANTIPLERVFPRTPKRTAALDLPPPFDKLVAPPEDAAPAQRR